MGAEAWDVGGRCGTGADRLRLISDAAPPSASTHGAAEPPAANDGQGPRYFSTAPRLSHLNLWRFNRTGEGPRIRAAVESDARSRVTAGHSRPGHRQTARSLRIVFQLRAVPLEPRLCSINVPVS